jgi:hypothetical protein
MTRLSRIAAIAAMTWIPSLALAQGRPRLAFYGHAVSTDNPHLSITRSADGATLTLSYQETAKSHVGPTRVWVRNRTRMPNRQFVNPGRIQPRIPHGVRVYTVITSTSSPQRAVAEVLTTHHGYTVIADTYDRYARPTITLQAPRRHK